MKSVIITCIAITAFVYSCSPSNDGVNEICPDVADSAIILTSDTDSVIVIPAKDSVK